MSVRRPNSPICEHVTNGEATRPPRRCWTAGLDIGKRRPARLVATVEDHLNWWALAPKSKSLAQMNKSEDGGGALRRAQM